MKYNGKTFLVVLITGIIVIICGVIFSILGGNQLKRDTVPAEAEVVEYVEDSEMRGKIWVDVYYPVVTYEADGQTLKVQYSGNYEDKPYEIGQKITVKYNPEDPTEFVIEGDSDGTHFSGIWAVILGGVIILGDIIWLIISKIKA